MSEKSVKFLVYVIKGGIFLLPFLVLMVTNSLFFPFITTKNFFFRMMVEGLFFLWVLAAVFDKTYRPKLTPVLWAAIAVVAVLSLATIFGENPYRSFWSNYERMEGLVSHLHLFAYFLVLVSVFKTKRDWKQLFSVMLFVSAVVGFIGLLQYTGRAEIHQSSSRLDATFGNATYLAIYMIFHMFLTALFFYWFRNMWVRIGLGVFFVFQFFVMFLTGTRGSILGFFGGLLLLGILMAVFSKNKKLRYGFGGVVLFVIVLVSLFLVFKDSSFVRNDQVLGRFANISFTETTTESRLTIWGMAWDGFQEHPVLGWGPENFNLVFNKYFEPKLYRQEPWFDHAHNIVFDWLISGGMLGFFAYFGLFGTALFLVWRGYRKGFFGLFEAAGITSVFAAYTFHNLFVFDNLTSYVTFFTVLGFVHSVGSPAQKNQRARNDEIGGLGYLAVTGAFLLVIFSFYFINLKPLFANNEILGVLMAVREGAQPDAVLKRFDNIFKYNSFGSGEAAEQLASYANQLRAVNDVPQETKTKVTARAIEEMKIQVEKSGNNDIRYLVFLTGLYTGAGRLDDAMSTINRALEISPNKQQLYFPKSDIFINAGKYKEARDVMKQAYDLDPSYEEAVKNLAVLDILSDRREEAESVLMTRFGTTIVPSKNLLNAYAKIGDYEKTTAIWLAIIETEPDNAQNYVSLAASYLKLGEREKTVESLQKAAELNPKFKEQADYFIAEIRAGRNP